MSTIFLRLPEHFSQKPCSCFLGQNPIQNKPFDPSHRFLNANLTHIEPFFQKSSKKAEIWIFRCFSKKMARKARETIQNDSKN